MQLPEGFGVLLVPEPFYEFVSRALALAGLLQRCGQGGLGGGDVLCL